MERANSRHCGKRHGGVVLRMLTLAVTLVLFWGVQPGSAAAPDSYEGPGYPSPEDAARAYLEGMQSGDLSQMLAAFAIESYVAHYDFQGHLERIKTYMPSLPVRLPNANPLFQAINVETRKAEVVNGILYQLLAFHVPDQELNAPAVFKSDAEVAQFVSNLEENTDSLALTTLQIGEVIWREILIYESAQKIIQESYARQLQILGTDSIESVVIGFAVGGQDYILCCDAVRYDGAWYLLNLGGTMGNLLGIPPVNGGIIPAQ